MLVFVMLAKALRGGGRETQAALSVVVRKGRKMLKQAANSLFAEMAVHTHGCHAGPAVRQEGQENKSPRCHCSDKSPEGTLESHSAPRKVFCVHSLPSQHTARGLPSSQELQGALEQGESCPAAHESAHAACPQRSLGITKHRAEWSLGTAAAACLGQCLGFSHGCAGDEGRRQQIHRRDVLAPGTTRVLLSLSPRHSPLSRQGVIAGYSAVVLFFF